MCDDGLGNAEVIQVGCTTEKSPVLSTTPVAYSSITIGTSAEEVLGRNRVVGGRASFIPSAGEVAGDRAQFVGEILLGTTCSNAEDKKGCDRRQQVPLPQRLRTDRCRNDLPGTMSDNRPHLLPRLMVLCLLLGDARHHIIAELVLRVSTVLILLSVCLRRDPLALAKLLRGITVPILVRGRRCNAGFLFQSLLCLEVRPVPMRIPVERTSCLVLCLLGKVFLLVLLHLVRTHGYLLDLHILLLLRLLHSCGL
mmetsp:Transcript_118108/g.376571  ORF Transcript_118108/g.376571 Transcript_118108/m.376571 type:complete len:253 (-) Transcript_118108:270-1028(-)